MSKKNQDPTRGFTALTKYLPIVIVVIILCILTIYFSKFNGEMGDQAIFGAFGDFVGGTLNPILSFITILLLVYSLRFQIEELTYTRKEIEKTNEIHTDNIEQQKTLFAIERYIGELDFLKSRIEKQLTKPVIEVKFTLTTFVGPAAKEGTDYKWEKFTLEDLMDIAEHYEFYRKNPRFDTVIETLNEISELSNSFDIILNAIEETECDPRLYQITKNIIEHSLMKVIAFKKTIDEIESK
ncbi:hypothetical protein ACXIUX_22935 [Vibrio parahaemolyticus]